MVDLFAPSVADDQLLRRAWARYERHAATPGATVAIVRLNYEERRPRRAAMQFACRRWSSIVAMRAASRWSTGGTWPSTSRARATSSCQAWTTYLGRRLRSDRRRDRGFVTGVRPRPEPQRVLATVLFTDIVGSTELAARLGDERWRELLGGTTRLVRREMDRFGAARSDRRATGSSRPSTARRGRSAAPARSREGVRDARDRDPGRAAHRRDRGPGRRHRRDRRPHRGARRRDGAGRDEVLVSGTVKDLVVGSGLDVRRPWRARPQGRARRVASPRSWARQG